jgi:exportin-5
MLKVLENILMSRPTEYPEHAAYTDAVKDLHTDCMHELHRLATKMPDHMLVRDLWHVVDACD